VHEANKTNSHCTRFLVDKDMRIVAHCFEDHSVEKGKYTITALRRLGLEDLLAARAVHGGNWPEPEPLGEELPPVPPFTTSMLPESLRPLVLDVSERMQTPPDFAAAAAVVALAGVTGRRARIWPKAEDTSWEVIPNLWGGMIAPPGFLKTSVMQAIMRALTHIEEMWRSTYVSELEQYDMEMEKRASRTMCGNRNTRRQ
jgi:Protein of unknown function (DUF3987)